MRKGATLAGLVLAATVVAAFSSRLDQKCADDYAFQTLTKASFIGMNMLIFSVAIWSLLFEDNLGGLSGFNTFNIALAGWSLGYFYTRIRGTGA